MIYRTASIPQRLDLYLRRVDKFSGGEDEWKAWEYDFKVSARAADAILVQAIEVAEIESKDITAADFSELEVGWPGGQVPATLRHLVHADFRREVGNSRGTWRGWNRCMASACQKLCLKDFGEGAEAIPGSDEPRIRYRLVCCGGSDCQVGDEVERTGKN